MAMEIYYLIEDITTATARNENFPGECHLRYIGKENKCLYSDGHKNGWYNYNFLTPGFVREYGYTRKCDAVRNWSYKNPDNSEYWKGETRVVRAWVRKDGNVVIC